MRSLKLLVLLLCSLVAILARGQEKPSYLRGPEDCTPSGNGNYVCGPAPEEKSVAPNTATTLLKNQERTREDGSPCQAGDGVGVYCYPAPEPMDVPAVQEEHRYKTGFANCRASAECEKEPVCFISVCEDNYATEKITTCADKSRVLLTSEDGKKHCIKF